MASVLVGNSTKRDGACTIRSAGGLAILDETYHYLVKCDQKDEPYVSVLSTTGLPLVGITASPSGFGVCRSKSATRRVDNPFYWDVVCEFSSEVDERQNNQNPASDPVTWVPIYETKFWQLQELVTTDVNDDPIVNSAGQPFSSGMTVTRFYPMWEFFQIEAATVTDQQIIDRCEVVNSGTFRTYPAKTLLLTVLSSVVGFYYGARRRLTQYQIKYNPKKWTHKRADVGTLYLESGELKPYIVKGSVVNGPLDGAGNKVATAGDPPAILEFDMYESVSFSFLRT